MKINNEDYWASGSDFLVDMTSHIKIQVRCLRLVSNII